MSITLLSACGSSSTADTGGVTSPSELSLFAGSMGGSGKADGTGAAASFNSPTATATDSEGNVYVADSSNNTIRKITAAGVVTTLAGTAGSGGSADGTGAAARFNNPQGIAADSAGNVYVADTSNSTIRKITSAGVVTTLAGTAGSSGSVDDTGAAASFNAPFGLATDGAGNVYVADTYNSTIRKIVAATGVVTTLAGTAGIDGSADGTGAAASFGALYGIAADSAGNVYVADAYNGTIRKIIASTGVVTTLAGTTFNSGSADGTGAAASFNNPNDIATDSAGNVYVADTDNHTIRKITAAGVVTTLAGTAGSTGSADGTGATALFYSPFGIATDSAGNLYVADTNNSVIRKVTPTGVVSTLAGAVLVTGSADGTGAAASFYSTHGLATDSAGNVYVADANNQTIRKITSAGVVTTLAGTAGSRGSADGTGAAARFNYPLGLATDSTGNLYVADNNAIRKITPDGVVTTLAGNAGSSGSVDGTGAAARFSSPGSVATDGAGNVYVADTNNHTIRKITPAGVVTTLTGTARSSGSADGTGAAARFNYPYGLATDSTGNLYVADSGNITVRKITSGGVVTTLAGTAGSSGSADGTGAAARFNFPYGLATDSAGNVYVADTENNTIRKITPAGVVSTVVGSVGKNGFAAGDLPGIIREPIGLAVFQTTLYFTGANGVAKVSNLP